MNQQRHPLLQPATSETEPRQRVSRFRLWGRIVALSMVLLVCSCSTLTPDRIAVLAALAGNAAQIGVQEWLKLHPEHRESFEAVARAIAAFLAAQGTPPDARESVVAQIMGSLPTATLKGSESELYMSGDHLVVWDGLRGKASVVDGKATRPVLNAVRNGMLRALAPVPPLPPAPPLAVRVRTHRNYQSATNTLVISNSPDGYDTVRVQDVQRYFEIQPGAMWVRTNNTYTLEAPTGWHTNVVQSTTPIPAGKYSPRRGIYVVELKSGSEWVTVNTLTNAVGEWRVRRVR